MGPEAVFPMRIPSLVVLSSWLVVLTVPSACGSDEAPIRATTGTGDSGVPQGGSGGTAGSTSTGGTPPATGGSPPAACDLQALGCQPLSVAGFELPACCATATTCGVDTSSVAPLLMGALPAGCFDLSGLADAGAPGSGVTILDGGIIPIDGGANIHLDPTCPGVDLEVPTFGTFTLAGCCTPENMCGGSTHELGAMGVSLDCLRNDDVSSALSEAVGTDVSGIITVSPDPNQACTYARDTTTPPDGGAPTDASQPPDDATAPATDAGGD
jgi:hypothetical protein